MSDREDLLREFADAGVDFLTVVASRQEIETLDVSGCLKPLNALLTSRENALQFRSRVNFIVDGYDDDPRELYEIPEVRAFVAALDREWPQWFYFLAKCGGILTIVALCLCRYQKIGPGQAQYERNDMERFLVRHFEAMNEMFERLGLPDSLNREVTDEVMQCLIL